MKTAKLINAVRKPLLKLTSPRHREMFAAHRQWRADQAERRRYDYPSLNEHSTVVDLGGFRGEWADGIFVRYQATVHIFEPHPDFAASLADKYVNNPKIHVHPCALSSADAEFELSDLADGSSAHRSGGARRRCCAVEAGAYLRQIGVDQIDLLKINIEGGEYDILPHLGAIGALPQVRMIQVQFHLLTNESETQRDAIRRMLQQTHRETWCYPFVWEQWEAA